MILKVIDVDFIKDFQLSLTFNNGETKTVNLENHLEGEIFEPLRDKSLFTQYALTSITIEWVNGADFAPEFLYELGIRQETGDNQLHSIKK